MYGMIAPQCSTFLLIIIDINFDNAMRPAMLNFAEKVGSIYRQQVASTLLCTELTMIAADDGL